MATEERMVLPLTNYECHVTLSKEGSGIEIDRRFVLYPTASIVFLLLSWGVGTIILVANGTCSTCLDLLHVLMAVCSGAVVVLIAGWVSMCCGVCIVSALQLGTPSS